MNILIKNVSKEFKKNLILKNINMNLEAGNIYGFAGGNGSGKSLLMKLICGLYAPTTGEILFDNQKIDINSSYPPVSALIERPAFFGNLTGYQNLELLANIKKEIGKEEILKALKIVNLVEYDKKYEVYSLGMKQKLGIAQAIMEDTPIVILDEPFNGIEDNTVIQIKNHLKELKKLNKIIIISSHIGIDLQELCDKIYYFDNGEVSLK